MIDLSKFIPEVVKSGIMRAMDDMAELVKHRIQDLVKRIEFIVMVGSS